MSPLSILCKRVDEKVYVKQIVLFVIQRLSTINLVRKEIRDASHTLRFFTIERLIQFDKLENMSMKARS